MPLEGLARMRPRRNDLKPHRAHESCHPFGIHHIPLLSQPIGHARRSVVRLTQIPLVNHSLQLQVFLGFRNRGIVIPRACNACQSALPPNGIPRVGFHPIPAGCDGQAHNFFSSHLMSIFRRPISSKSGVVTSYSLLDFWHLPPENISSAFSRSRLFHCETWLGWT